MRVSEPSIELTKEAFPVKKLSTTQSRSNITQRKAIVGARRHAKAGHWTAQTRPMLGSGHRHDEVGGKTEAMSCGGIAPVHRLVTTLGLRSRIDADLGLLKVHVPYHESDHVLNIADNVLCGGTRLEDSERLRHDVASMNALDADF